MLTIVALASYVVTSRLVLCISRTGKMQNEREHAKGVIYTIRRFHKEIYGRMPA